MVVLNINWSLNGFVFSDRLCTVNLINLHDRTAGVGILRGGWLFIGDFFNLNYFRKYLCFQNI